MIQRSPISASISNSEPLHQTSFTAMKGIDSSKAITTPNVVQSIENLDVNSDGSVSIRKPLIIKKEYKCEVDGTVYTAKHVIPTHLTDYTLIVYGDAEHTYLTLEDTYGSRHPIAFYIELRDYTSDVVLTLPSEVQNVYDVEGILDLHGLKSIVTPNSTVLGNVFVNIASTLLKDIAYSEDVYGELLSDFLNVPRYLHFTYFDDVFKITIKTPEINTLSTGDTFTLNNNLTLDDPYAIRDSYDSGYVSVDGILPYAYSKDSKTPDILFEPTASGGETYEHNYSHFDECDLSSYEGMLASANPMLIYFHGEYGTFNSATAWLYEGGTFNISFNKFSLSGNPEVNSTKPSRVVVNVKGTRLHPDIPLNVSYDGYYTLDDVFRTFEIEKTYQGDSIWGNAADGWWIQVQDVPFVGALAGTPNNDFRYEFVTNKVTPSGDKSFEINIYTYEHVSTDPITQYAYFSKVNSDITRYNVTGNCFFDIRISLTVEYPNVINTDFPITVKQESYFNILNFPGHRATSEHYALIPWLNPEYDEYAVGIAYPILIDTLSSPKLTIDLITKKYSDKSTEISKTSTSVNVTRKLVTDVETKDFTINGKTYKYRSGTFRTPTVLNGTVTVANRPKAILKGTLKLEAGDSVFASEVINLTNTSNQFAISKTLKTRCDKVSWELAYSVKTPTTTSNTPLEGYTVEMLTERTPYPKFQIANVVKDVDSVTLFLKAFMHLVPSASLEYYGIWEYTLDGVSWNSWYNPNPDVAESISLFKQISIPTYTLSKTEAGKYKESLREAYGVPFKPVSVTDKLYTIVKSGSKEIVSVLPERPDVAFINTFTEQFAKVYNVKANVPVSSARFRFTVCTLPESDDSSVPIATILATKDFTFNTGLKWEFATTELANAVLGDKLYYKNAIYSYGNEDFGNNILVSDANSFITPISNVIDVTTSVKSNVVALVPWRDYLVAFTEYDAHLITRTSEGAYTKTVTTYTGMPRQDRKTCKAILNGVIFKSGSKFYTLYPNTTSGDESILNLNEISHAINHILEALPKSEYDAFSMSTERKYYTFIPYEAKTYCIIYDYNLRVWYTHLYDGVRLTGYNMQSLDNITLYGMCNGVYSEYHFDKLLRDTGAIEPNEKFEWDDVPYGDFLTKDSLVADPTKFPYPIPTPIHFTLDSGQRTDNISLTKKFVESKFVLATLNSKAAANITVDVYVDGNPYKVNLKGDGLVYKESPNDTIALGESMTSNDSEIYDTVSQVFLRYSGRGKTIRHVIEGDSLYNFKLYEVFYRYRPMPNKQ